ncbi:MAG TPA: MFS transporter [Thermoanaerobaculia bacterium]|nr:MFS transporter [Thermoanaerobaculia bacterium]
MHREAPAAWRDFSLVWAGQTISLLGSEITTFGLGVWMYQRTGSVTSLAMIFAFAAAPGLLLSPVAGVLLDRFSRRRGLILTNLGAALGPLALLSLLLLGRLETWCVYVIVAVATAFLAFQVPAFSAAVTLMVSSEQLGRASGLLQFGGAGAQILAPLLAGALLPRVGLAGLVAIDALTFGAGIVTLVAARIPDPPPVPADAAAAGFGLAAQVAVSVRYLRRRPGLLRLLAFFAVGNFLLAMCQVLQTPLVLARYSPARLGLVVSAGSCGLLAGSLVMSAWGGPARRVLGILGLFPLLGLGAILMGVAPSAALIAAGVFGILLVVPIINGCDQALWQSSVEPGLQGRVFSTRQLLEQFTAPIAYLAAGPLADRVFEPLLRVHGPLAGSVGSLVGVGPGRGIGLMFVVIGVLLLGNALLGFASPRLRGVELQGSAAAAGPPAVGVAVAEKA